MDKEIRYAIIDVETTGGNPARDRMTEVAIYIFDGEKVIDSFTSLINPTVPIPEFITGITGIDNDMVRHAPKFFEVARRIVEMTEGAVFVAHNVRFDYSFFQKEFRSLGYTFSRRQLCTVKLSRKILPGFPSYSLKNLCIQLGITNDASHRAWGDASATTTLFQKLIQTDPRHIQDSLSRQSLAQIKLPPQLPVKVVDDLPDETGIYYFFNRRHEVIYVGKSNNIRKRVMSHFQGAYKSSYTIQMLEDIADVNFEITGSELVAMLRENEEIKRLQPLYNRLQLRTKYKYSLYHEPDEQGYLRLSVGPYNLDRNPAAGFNSRAHAESAIKRKAHEYRLCLKLCGLETGKGRCFYRQIHLCDGACEGAEEPSSYNDRVEMALSHMPSSVGKESFLVVGEGRSAGERSVVWVHKGSLKGYGYHDDTLDQRDLQDVIQSLSPVDDIPDVARILRGYVRKHPKEIKILS